MPNAQGLFLAILVGGGAIPTVLDGKNLQNFLICVQMLPASIAMLFAFPYQEYKGSGASQSPDPPCFRMPSTRELVLAFTSCIITS